MPVPDTVLDAVLENELVSDEVAELLAVVEALLEPVEVCVDDGDVTSHGNVPVSNCATASFR